jgi:tRNA pseudouridine55 synthase
MLTGALLVDKPGGVTSHDVVARVRRVTGERRTGHTGTLDPFATGLLVLCLGRATRLARFVSELRKSYRATVRFGFATDTFDRTGSPRDEPTGDPPSRDALEAALPGFVGPQWQLPPPFSAKKVGGKRAHRLARSGAPVRLAPARIEIEELRLVDYSPPRATLETTVSSGTYVRSLANDLGRKLGCGAHLEELRRIRVGSFAVEAADSLKDLERYASGGRIPERLLPPAELLRDLPAESLAGEDAVRFRHGREVSVEREAGLVLRVFGPEGAFLGVAEAGARGRSLRPLVVWARI